VVTGLNNNKANSRESAQSIWMEQLVEVSWGCDCWCYGASLCLRLHVATELRCSHCDVHPPGLYRHCPLAFAQNEIIQD
jgi:hypothetical protein